jgi:hypothetical protein
MPLTVLISSMHRARPRLLRAAFEIGAAMRQGGLRFRLCAPSDSTGIEGLAAHGRPAPEHGPSRSPARSGNNRRAEVIKDRNVNRKEELKPGSAPSPCEGAPREQNGPCIEYLQRAVAQLLMKNEKMRFELFAVRQKIASIETAVFGAGSHNLRTGLPLFLLGALSDLCREEKPGDQHPAARRTVADRMMAIRRNGRPIGWIRQANESVDRGR